jgi:O-antigen ligase
MPVDRPHYWEGLIFQAFLAVLVAAPVLFGAVYAWVWGSLAGATGLVLVAWSLNNFGTAASIPVGLRLTWPLIAAFALVVAWAAFQAFWPTPVAWHHPLWGEAATALHHPVSGRVGLDPGLTAGSLLRIGTDAAIFWLSMEFGRTPQRAKRIIVTLALTGFGCALYGLAVYAMGNSVVLWLPKHVYQDDLTSTFINRNSYATYAGLGWLCVIALAYRSLAGRTETRSGPTERLRSIFWFVARRGFYFLTGALVVAGALLHSHSRGGLIATGAGTIVFCIALLFNRSHDRWLTRRFGMAALILALIVFATTGRIVEQRLSGTDMTTEDRPLVYALTMKATADQPWLGTGLGTFEEAFRLYRTPDIATTYAQAHNSYLETVLELGFPATALLFVAFGFVAFNNLRGVWVRRRDTIYPCLGVAATVLVGAHAMVDFSIQIPGIAMTYAAILGVALAQSWSTR